jgi:hypothetical protein
MKQSTNLKPIELSRGKLHHEVFVPFDVAKIVTFPIGCNSS